MRGTCKGIQMKERLIRITVEESGRRIHATSPDLPGLFVSERTEDELMEAIPQVIALLFEADGQTVIVRELDEGIFFLEGTC